MMQAHQHTMAASVESHERNLSILFAAANGDIDDTPADQLAALGINDADTAEDTARDAIMNYALDSSTKTILTVTLGIGGPTQHLSATIERSERGGWERAGRVAYVDSWAVPEETELADSSALVTLFDEHVEMMGDDQ